MYLIMMVRAAREVAIKSCIHNFTKNISCSVHTVIYESSVTALTAG